MRHRKVGRKFGRESHQRLALMRSLCTSLIKYEKIITTLPKAKDLRRFVERAVTMAKKEGALKNQLLTNFLHSHQDKEIIGRDAIKRYISNLRKEDRERVEKYIEDPTKNPKPDFIIDYLPANDKRKMGPRILRVEGVLSKLVNKIAPRFKEVPGGYTRIYKLGNRRGDNAQLAVIEFSR